MYTVCGLWCDCTADSGLPINRTPLRSLELLWASCYLLPALLRAAAAVGGPEAEALGAALGVGGVQVEGAHPALVTARALHILLHMRGTVGAG